MVTKQPSTILFPWQVFPLKKYRLKQPLQNLLFRLENLWKILAGPNQKQTSLSHPNRPDRPDRLTSSVKKTRSSLRSQATQSREQNFKIISTQR